MTKQSRWALLVGAALALQGCGGGSGDAVTVVAGGGTATAPTPTPTPTATATPTPTPTSTADPTLATVAVNTELEGFEGANGYYRASDGSLTQVEELATAATFPVIALAPGFLYRFYGSILGDRAAGQFALSTDYAASTSSFSVYRGQSNGVDYRFTQLVVGADNPTQPLLYSSVALARGSFFDSTANATRTAVNPIAFGLFYDYSKAALTGSATYRGIVVGSGRAKNGTHVYDISGTFEVALNYDTTAFTGQLKLTGRDDLTGEMVDLGTVTLYQDRPRGVLDYLYAGTAANASTGFQGHLAGAHGQELLAAMDLRLPDPKAPTTTLVIATAMAGSR